MVKAIFIGSLITAILMAAIITPILLGLQWLVKKWRKKHGKN